MIELLFAGRYDLGPVIGRGGMGEVRAGRDVRLERAVAIKLLHPGLAAQPAARARFEAEARTAARLIHPNVVAVFDSGEFDGVPYIAMERLPGFTLRDRLAAGPLPDGEARRLALDVLAALDAAHAAGIVHRDIKPSNILATDSGHWKVGDFGIAKLAETDATTGVVVGTPAYLAPERLYGGAATVASDLYSLGVVLYEARAGRRSDPYMTRAVERSLAPDPVNRFRSAADMAGVIAHGDADRTAVLPVLRRPWTRRVPAARHLAAMAAAAVVALLLAGLAVAAGGGDRGHARTPPGTAPAAAASTLPPTTTTTPSTTIVPQGPQGKGHGNGGGDGGGDGKRG